MFSIHEPQAAAPGAGAKPTEPGLLLPAEAVGPVALREAAASGDATAQFVVALRYLKGDNAAEAVRWLERAASAGLAPAQYRLGAMYERGQGVAKDLGARALLVRIRGREGQRQGHAQSRRHCERPRRRHSRL